MTTAILLITVGRGIDTGRGMLTWQADAVKAHNHLSGGAVNNGGISIYGSTNASSGYRNAAQITATNTYRPHHFYSSTTGAATNRVRTVAVMFLIKFR